MSKTYGVGKTVVKNVEGRPEEGRPEEGRTSSAGTSDIQGIYFNLAAAVGMESATEH